MKEHFNHFYHIQGLSQERGKHGIWEIGFNTGSNDRRSQRDISDRQAVQIRIGQRYLESFATQKISRIPEMSEHSRVFTAVAEWG